MPSATRSKLCSGRPEDGLPFWGGFIGGTGCLYRLEICPAPQFFCAKFRLARIRAEELKEKIDRGEDLMIFDVRHPLEFHANPQVIPGAVYAPLEGWKEEDYSRLKDKEIIVYCG